MTWAPREGTKIAVLLAAMEADRATHPTWSQAEAAEAMDVPRAMVPNYVAAACNAERLFRRTVHGGIELSLQRFPAPGAAAEAADLRIPTFGKGAAAAAADSVTGFVPPKMTAPRPGSEHPRVLASSPKPAPLSAPVSLPSAAAAELVRQQHVPDWPGGTIIGPGAAAADAQIVASELRAQADAEGDRQIEKLQAIDAARQASIPEEAGGEPPPDEAEEETQPDAYISCRTGEIVLVGCPVDEEGRVTIPADLVQSIKRQIAWSPAR